MRAARRPGLALGPVARVGVALGLAGVVGCTRVGDDLRPRPADATPADAFVIGPDARPAPADATAAVDAGAARAVQPVESARVSSEIGSARDNSTGPREELLASEHPPGTP